LKGFLSACSAISAVIVVICLSACGNKPPDSTGGCTRLAADRAAKDEMFQKGIDPVPENRKAALLPLAYFPCDQDYMVPAGLKPSQDDTVIQIPTSTGALRAMRRAGTLEFSIKEQPSKLTAFVDLSDRNLDHLFVMFSDLTSGTETYPAGRYLDLTRNATGVYELDFNRCYQPYCYYNESYECPYPPAENRLKIPIRAGERMKK
jgi:uncharacterized protein (DUF1684 family)